MDFDYNTSRKKIILPEYGRNIHKMVEHVKGLTDREERNRAAHAVISVMGNLNPHLRDIVDFKHKLWDHLAIISDFDLDIDWPYPLPTKETLQEPPLRVPYNQNNIRYKHYGKLVYQMIGKAKDFEENDEKKYLLENLANNMKKFYLTWNREAVNDEVIYNDMKEMSNGKIVMNPELKLSDTRDILRNKRQNNQQPTNTTPVHHKKVIRKNK